MAEESEREKARCPIALHASLRYPIRLWLSSRRGRYMSTYRVGIDIGGTFTDAAFVDEQTGAIQIIKVPSTPADPSGGCMAAVERG